MKDLEELCPIPVPGDDVSGFLLCAMGKPLAQMSARTVQGPVASRVLRDTELSRVSAVPGLLASLRMPEFGDLASPWTVNALNL